MDVLGAEGSAGALVLNRGVQRQMQAHKPIIRLRRLYWSRALSNLLISVERSDPRQCRIQLRYLLCLPAWTRAWVRNTSTRPLHASAVARAARGPDEHWTRRRSGSLLWRRIHIANLPFSS